MNPENQYFSPPQQPQPQNQWGNPAPSMPHHQSQGFAAPVHHQPPQPEPPKPMDLPPNNGVRPTPVVKVLSPFGVEYVFLTVSLFIAAFAFTGILLLLVNGETGFAALSFPAAALAVALPAFAGLFLHLKKMELHMPELKLDASKRRSTQFTQIVAFITCMFTLIGFLFAAFASMGGEEGISVGKAALNALCILAVAGGILAYYWRDEHIVKR